MRRLVLTLSVLAATLVVAPASAGAYLTGISDQQASTFTNPLYAPLKLRIARYITPYDVMSDPAQLAKLDAWVRSARAARQRILVSFEHSRLPRKAGRLPSVAAYTRALRAFKRAYPDIREINSWNEVNRRFDPRRGEGQPTWNKPRRVAQYYLASRKVFRGAKIVGLDVLDERDPTPAVRFIKAFKRYARPLPRYWGIHNYSDTNRGDTKRTRRIIKAIGRRGEIWLLETGGIVKLGRSFPYNEARAARALGCMFHITKVFPRVKRLYVYQFNAGTPDASFDAGLINLDGSKRPGWNVVKARKARRC